MGFIVWKILRNSNEFADTANSKPIIADILKVKMVCFSSDIIGGRGYRIPKCWFKLCYWFVFMLFGLCLSNQLFAMKPVILLDKHLNQNKAYLNAIKDGKVYYYDKQRRMHDQSIDQFVHIYSVNIEEAYIPSDIGIIEFVDGQQILGKLSEYQHHSEDGFLWECYIGGEWVKKNDYRLGNDLQSDSEYRYGMIKKIPVSLNEVSRMSFTGKLFDNRSEEHDLIKLRNGEIIRGYLMNVEEDHFLFQLADQELTIKIDIDQVEALNLLNAHSQSKSYAYSVLLNDGSKVLANYLSISQDKMKLGLSLTGQGTEKVEMPIGVVKEINNLSSGYRLQYLAKMDYEIGEPSVVFGKSYRLQFLDCDIQMHAPMTLRYRLPEGAVKMSGVVEMDEQDDLPQLSKWADMNLILRKMRLGKSYRFHLNHENPKHEFTIDLLGEKELVIELDPGMNGPVLDRMIMRDAVLLVKQKDFRISLDKSEY